MAGEASNPTPKFSTFKTKLPVPPPKTSEGTPSAAEHDGKRQRLYSDEPSSNPRRHRGNPERKPEGRSRQHDREANQQYKARRGRSPIRVNEISKSSTRAAALRSDETHINLPAPGFHSNDFRVDLRGDFEHLTLRMIAGKIPRFRRIGRGHVLGAPDCRIDRRLSDNKATVLYLKQDTDWRHDRPLESKQVPNSKQGYKLIRGTRSRREIPGEFISLRHSSTRRDENRTLGHTPPLLSGSRRDAQKSSESSNGDSETASSDDNSRGDSLDIIVNPENAKLQRCAQEEPDNPQAWLALAEYQDAVIRLNTGRPSGRLSQSEQRALSEVRLSIYERALKGIVSDTNKEPLLLARLEEGAMIWSAEKLSQQWKEALLKNKRSSIIWLRYLDSVQCDNSHFEYGVCILEFQKCLDVLASAIKLSADASQETKRLCETQLHVFVRLTRLVADAGYHELAEALWQAVLEYHFFKPDNLSSNQSEALQSFEQFWDSEVPRIGEATAKGWCNGEDDMQDSLSGFSVRLEQVESKGKIFEEFGRVERDAAAKTQRPGRVSDEPGEEDPFHVILFSDLSPYAKPMFHSDFQQEDVIQAFLCFLGLPLISIKSLRDTSPMVLDPFLWRSGLGSQDEVLIMEGSMSTSEPQVRDSWRLRNCILTTGLLFDQAAFRSEPERAAWTLRVITQLVHSNLPNETLAEYALAVGYHLDRQNFRKLAKEVMSKRRNSIYVANAYAMGDEITDGQIINLIELHTKANGSKTDVMLLWRTLVWRALRANDFEAAAHLLLSIGDTRVEAEKKTRSTALYLRTQDLLIDCRHTMLSKQDPRKAVVCAELVALLAYLCSEAHDNLSGALEVFSTSIKELEDNQLASSIAHEEIHQSRTTFLLHYISNHRHFNPAAVSSIFEQSLIAYPHNTLFMAACATIKSSALSLTPPLLSRLVDDPKTSSIVNTLFNIATTARRPAGASADSIFDPTPRTRNAFERAAGTASARHSPLFWTSYFRFEVVAAQRAVAGVEKARQRARDVFFRGLAELPWSKWYVMLAFEHEALFKRDELKSLWALLGRRGFRVHVDVEGLVMAA